ncbi:MAG TPA: hypothetical protein VL490_09450 [Mucilaginibacter sp.]|jgi:hypothetical protein|nr:hypothetical protein [Mucilaginibacter sp.]
MGLRQTTLVITALLLSIALSSCSGNKKIYTSTCDNNITFKHIAFTHLIDSLDYYDKKYIEVSGRYEEGKEESALFNDSLFSSKPNAALWVNFSPDCPLYLAGTHTGFFEYNNGAFTQINKKKVIIRGKLDVHNKGNLKQYKACIDHVSFIEL